MIYAFVNFGQVLMVVGAGRGPLVRASLQVFSYAICNFEPVVVFICVSFFTLIAYRQLKKLDVS